jgi:RNase P protein component
MINGGQYVFVAKNGIDKEKFENIKRDFLYTLKKLNLMQR